MDNVSHALAGLLIAEVALLLHARRRPPVAGLRRGVCFASIAANNLPDLDFVYMGVTPGKLGYLLHHRGHTHTLAAALPCALIVLGLAVLLVRRQHANWARAEWLTLIAVCAIGPLSHLALDFSNNYGIHPFWPFDNRWYYGDSIFIIEPWFWVVGLPSLFYLAHARWSKVLYALLLVGILVVAWSSGVVPRGSLLALAGSAALLLVALRRASSLGRVLTAVVGSALVVACFGALSSIARARVLADVRAHFTHAHVLDIVLTPIPATPLCFSALVLTLETDVYRARTASVAPLPHVREVIHCPPAPLVGTAAERSQLIEIQYAVQYDASAQHTAWHAEYSAKRNEITDLAARSCEARALLQFVRTPYVVHRQGGTVLGDLRYDRNADLDFADIQLTQTPRCPPNLPPWTPPRADLLSTP